MSQAPASSPRRAAPRKFSICAAGRRLGIFVVFGAALLRAQDPPADPAELARELRRTPPLEPANALRSFQIREGFQIQLVAAEPDVVDPVALAFDEEGRMFVVEMRDYPFEPGKGQSPEQIARAHSGRVRVLEDVDGDARVDRGKIYADAISWPTGILCYRGGTFVTAAPDVFYLKDEDGDGVAERREVVFTGFARNNVQGLVNSLCWGLDNHVWGSSSSNGGEIRRAAAGRDGSADAPVGLRGRDFRFLPGDSAAACGPMEPAAGGGQFGMCFDDWGDRFVCNNSSHVRAVALETRYFERNPVLPAPACIVDIAEDGGAAPVHRSSAAEPWRLVRTRWRAASAERSRFAATELVPTGFFTSATGIHVYRGDAFPPEFRGSVFIGDVGGNLVHRKILVPKGSIFTACRPPGEVTREFLTSTDNWFRPVAFADGPDGALYVLDMYRETIEHPDSIPESIKSHVDLKSGDDRGRIYRIVPEGYARQPRPRLGAATVSELVGCLDSPSAWWRETAQRLLVERHARDAAEPLRSLAREGTHPLARLHALWTMDGLDVLSRGDLERAFTDRDPGVREAALRLAERFLEPDDRRDAKQDASLVAPIVRLAGDPALRVRRQAALALGFVASPEAAVALAAVARRRPLDDWTRAAVLSSCREHAADVLTALSSGSEALAPVNGAGSEDDLRGTLALLSGLAETAVYQRSALRGVLEAAATLGAASPVAPGTPGGASGASSQPTGTLDAAIAVLLGAGEGLRRNGATLGERLERREPELEGLAARVESVLGAARRSAAAAGAEESLRVRCVRLLGIGSFEREGATLAGLLDAREPQGIQIAALRALSSFRDARVGPLVAGRWRSLSPSVRREAAEVLFQRPDRLAALLDRIEDGSIAPSELDPDRRKRLLDGVEAGLRDRAQRVIGAAAPAGRQAVIESYRRSLEKPGDPERGRAAFRKACATCHRLRGEGQAVAPDFNTVRDRSEESLLVHILDPNREVAPSYLAYTVVARDGRVMTGIVANETSTSLTLRRAEGVDETILRSEIERLESSGLSLMPEGLEQQVSVEEMADLIEAIRAGG